MAQKRSIFQDVDAVAADDVPKIPETAKGVISGTRDGARRAISIWLAVLFVLVVLMIVVGGLTRLTDSGLSITEWALIKGAVPPLNDASWQLAFTKYQAIPEFQLQNSAMTLAEFKGIYWWEWGHRQLGRLVGLVWAAGFIWFLVRRQIPTGWTPRLFGVGVLGGLQGAIGWWMVSSGSSGRMVDVASYRLAIHLGLAFVILAVLWWFFMSMRRADMDLYQARRHRDGALSNWAKILMIVAFAQILLGALVAGIDAGRGYIDWPLMNGQFLPSESFDYVPFWSNFFKNAALVQFNHRLLGYGVGLLGGYIWWRSRGSANMATKRIFNWVLFLIFAQIVLGIGTVLYAAPWQIAILHQLGAVLLWVIILKSRFAAEYPQAQTIRGTT